MNQGLSFEAVKKSVSSLKGQLENFCKEEVMKISAAGESCSCYITFSLFSICLCHLGAQGHNNMELLQYFCHWVLLMNRSRCLIDLGHPFSHVVFNGDECSLKVWPLRPPEATCCLAWISMAWSEQLSLLPVYTARIVCVYEHQRFFEHTHKMDSYRTVRSNSLNFTKRVSDENGGPHL